MVQEVHGPPAFQRPSGFLFLEAQQDNLVDGVETLVILTGIPIAFTDGIEDTVNHRIITGIAGFYAIAGQVEFTEVVADKDYIVIFKLNAVVLKEAYVHSSLAANITASFSCPVMWVDAVEHLELFAISNAGVDTVDITHLGRNTFLTAQRVR